MIHNQLIENVCNPTTRETVVRRWIYFATSCNFGNWNQCGCRPSQGKICKCIEMRKPNKAIIVDAFPLPHMDELLLTLPFLGHIVSGDGQQPDPGCIWAIADAPVPTDASTLGSFFGQLSSYSKFLLNHATVVEPMWACLRLTDSDFQWTNEAQASFEAVKEMLADS